MVSVVTASRHNGIASKELFQLSLFQKDLLLIDSPEPVIDRVSVYGSTNQIY